MASKTSPINLTEAELEKILKEPSKPSDVTEKLEDFATTDIPEFISFYSIEEGSNFINNKFIFTLYREWSRYKYPSFTFTREFSKYFPFTVKKRTSGYLINLSKLNVSKQLFNFIRNKNQVKKSPVKINHIENFIKKFNLVFGLDLVSITQLYTTYDRWAYKNKILYPLKRKEFIALLKMYFKSTTFKGQTLFLLDKLSIKGLIDVQTPPTSQEGKST